MLVISEYELFGFLDLSIFIVLENLPHSGFKCLLEFFGGLLEMTGGHIQIQNGDETSLSNLIHDLARLFL